jgi:hypothetical protein
MVAGEKKQQQIGTGWWFGTVFVFHFIYGIILPID